MGTNEQNRRTINYLAQQPEVFDCPARHVVYVKGRRAGGTRGAVHRLVEIAHEAHPGSRHLWVDTVHRNIARYRALYFAPLLAGTGYRWDAAAQRLSFGNGSFCDFGTAQHPEHMEGFAYDYIWVNEAGLILRNEDIFTHTLQPMMAENPRAQVFLVGAPKGPGLFHRMYRWGQDAGEPDWASFRHSSYVNRHVSHEVLDAMRRHMTETAFRQEILAEFVESESRVFRSPERIATAVAEPEPLPGVPYVLGVDLARYEDYTVIWVGRADTRTGVACARFRQVPWDRQIAHIAEWSERYGHAPVYTDATGAGDPVCEAMRIGGIPVRPVNLSAERKQRLIEHLTLGIDQRALSIIPHEQTLRELQAYEQELLPSGHRRMRGRGEHDDCVIALALCYWGMGAWDSGFILGSPLESRD